MTAHFMSPTILTKTGRSRSAIGSALLALVILSISIIASTNGQISGF